MSRGDRCAAQRRRGQSPPLVLVVDDHAHNRTLLRDLLGSAFQVEEAATAEEALGRIQDHRPAAVLLDLELPGMGGLTLLRQLKSRRSLRDIPVVIVSAHTASSTRDRAFACGCADFVAKPIVEEPDEFVERIQKHVRHC